MSFGLTIRAFIALILAAIPPALAVLIGVAAASEDATTADVALIAGAVVLGSAAWIAVVAVVYSRAIQDEYVDIVELAERGERTSDDTASNRLAVALDERNRQLADLAAQVARAPIGDEPRRVAEHVVRAARQVTGDPTWLLAVLDSSLPDGLPNGVYAAGEGGGDAATDPEPAPITDLHPWASVSAAERLPARAHRLDGPWGAFLVIALAADDDLRAVLLAPWEGRADPSAADLALLSLVGEHAATAIEHAILYTRLRVQGEEIDRMASVQRDFLRAVSHDLQTPLTSIRAVAAELRAQPGLDEQAIEDLDLIEHQSDRLRRMVAQLLVVSRLEAGVVEPLSEVMNPRPIVERTWDALRASGRDLQVEVSGPSLLVVADPDRLEQALWAILDNAVKYSPAGRPVRVSIGPRADRAVIAITDEGMGMDADTAAMAAQQFFRAPDARRLAPDGSGIGLYAARGLMEAMGGSLGIASRPGHGTTITLELPAELVAEGLSPTGAGEP